MLIWPTAFLPQGLCTCQTSGRNNHTPCPLATPHLTSKILQLWPVVVASLHGPEMPPGGCGTKDGSGLVSGVLTPERLEHWPTLNLAASARGQGTSTGRGIGPAQPQRSPLDPTVALYSLKHPEWKLYPVLLPSTPIHSSRDAHPPAPPVTHSLQPLAPVFLEHSPHIPTAGPLHVLFPLPACPHPAL